MSSSTMSVERTLSSEFIRRYPEEAAADLETLEASALAPLLEGLDAAVSARLFEHLRPDLGASVLLVLRGEVARSLLHAVDPVRGAIVLSRLEEEDRRHVVSLLDAGDAREILEILSYPPDTAGAIMDPRVSHFRAESTVAEALARLNEVRHLRISSLHVVDETGRYVGSTRLQDVALAEPSELIKTLLGSTGISVQAMAPLAEVVDTLESHHLPSLPVVDFHGRLVGVIRHEALVSAVESDATADIQAMVGASRSEHALSKVSFAVKKRLPWLQINLLTAFLASFVVGLFESTIAQFTALAVLLPVVAGQSGNTGAQALAVTMRGLALREVRVRDAARVAIKESIVGFVNGLAVALVTAAAVWAWSQSPGLALVIGISMVMSMLIAGLAGATIPMVLTVMGQDPAQASSIILTTVTDVVGFLSFLGLATLLSSML